MEFDRQIIQKVIVTYDPTLTTPDAIVEAIEERGDKVTKVSKL